MTQKKLISDNAQRREAESPTSSYLSQPLRSLETAKVMKALEAQLFLPDVRDERQNGVRHAANEPARAFVPAQCDFVSCILRDVSEAGARLELRDELPETPERVYLYVETVDIIVECEPRWRFRQMMGIVFVKKNGVLCKALISE